jgi:5'-methylthioadenosine phosphorylase
MNTLRLGFIGGSGVYNIEGMRIVDKVNIKTPFGKTSDKILIGTFDGKDHIAFISRHGGGHKLLPTEVPSRANIWALKKLGVEYIIALSAVGSLREEIAPKHLVVPDQIIDRTRYRPESSFFGEGIVGHVSFASPYCHELRELLLSAARACNGTVHDGGTLLCVEGPMFSTRAESMLYRSWNANIIGMTAIPESRLAREAEIGYAALALVTDYDCWHEEEEAVTADMVMETMQANTALARQIVRQLATQQEKLPQKCSCHSAAAGAVMTARDALSKKAQKKLALFYGKYWRGR